LLADEGSGYWIGLTALKSVLRAVDGRGQETTLTDLVMKKLEISEARGMLQFVYGEEGTKANIAHVARLVMEQAEAGDAVSNAILDQAASDLIETIIPPYKKLFGETGEKANLGLWGGNLVHVATYRDRFLRMLEETGLPIEPVIDKGADAVVGAAKHALIEVTEGAGDLERQF